MKNFLLFWACLFLNLCCFAADSVPVIGVLDLGKVMMQSQASKKMDKQLSGKYTTTQKEILALQQSLKKIVDRFERESAVMTPSKKQEMQLSIKNKQRDLQRKQQDFQQDFSTDRNALLQTLFLKLRGVVSAYATKNHIDLVLQKDVVPFSSQRVDITDTVIKQFDRVA